MKKGQLTRGYLLTIEKENDCIEYFEKYFEDEFVIIFTNGIRTCTCNLDDVNKNTTVVC